MGSGFSKMKKQARLMQEQMQQAKTQMASTLVEGVAGGGLVRIVINGEKEIKKVVIQPECVDPKDVEGLQDLVVAAFADATQKLSQSNESVGQPFPFF